MTNPSTFSKIVNICLHDINDLSDVWYLLIQSKSLETPKTLAGLSLKSLLNDSLNDEQIKEQVEKIIEENEPIELSKLSYFKDQPELIQNRLRDHIRQLNGNILEIEILKSTCRLMVDQQFLAEISIGENFEWPLYYAQFATEVGFPEFQVSFSEGSEKEREYIRNKFVMCFPSMSVNGSCTTECYTVRTINDQQRSIATYKISDCINHEHKRGPAKPYWDIEMMYQAMEEFERQFPN